MRTQIRKNDLTLLKKGTVRQNWSKLTLYNLAQLKRQNTQSRTFYQQKYLAKQETRKYHGEALTKRQWQNIFKHSLKSTVTMNTQQLAQSDGSEFGAGRGSGLDGVDNLIQNKRVPYMNQTFAPMERRLDMAIFRAMFASSSIQARQFVIHGFVKVNGKQMKYPQYMLNPGDMFSVDIEKVLFATGAPKGLPNVLNPKARHKKKKPVDKSEEATEVDVDAKEADSEKTEAKDAEKSGEKNVEEGEKKDAVTKEGKTTSSEKKKPEVRHDNRNWWTDANRDKEYDSSKPYRTPWRPRYYLSAFAFIPRYLEVNHNTGHAVYLRHPVAKPGQSEVPTPFHHETMQLAYNWFLRRR